MTLPNFLIIGAAKSGTDSLNIYLGQHPEIYMSPNREPNYFVARGRDEVPYRGPGDRAVIEAEDMWVSSLVRYGRLFDGVTSETAIGESTTWYLYDEEVPARIRALIPQARLIAILRNPADRAYSAYNMMLRDGRESVGDFERALAAEPDRIRLDWEPIWHYTRMGFYGRQLRRYYDLFDREQIHVVVYDDFNARPDEVLQGIYRFLGVDDRFVADTSVRSNVSLVPRHLGLHALVAGHNSIKSALSLVVPEGVRRSARQYVVGQNLVRPPAMAPEVRRELAAVFRSDIVELQDLIGRDLQHWLA